jgi:hypothetical protein
VQHPVSLEEPTIDEQFSAVKETGAFDFLDRIPSPETFDEYRRAAHEYALPMLTGSWMYMLGQDDALIRENLRIAGEIGSSIHDMMIYTNHADGHVVTNAEIVDCYLRSYDEGMKLGVEPSFELHINMWSEDFRRVTPVALAVKDRGIPFNYTLDYSHVIFKIENPQEQEYSGIREDVEAGRLILDPFEPGNLCDEWLSLGIVRWMQVRPAVPNGPKNIWSDVRDEQGRIGRGVMYPFTRPNPGEWHSPWYAYKLEPAKEVVRKVLRHHQNNPASRLKFITTEMINPPNYGHNARFSLIEQNAAVARFVRNTWAGMHGNEAH